MTIKRLLVNAKPYMLSGLIAFGTFGKMASQNSLKFEDKKIYSKNLLSYAKTGVPEILTETDCTQFSELDIDIKSQELVDQYIQNVLTSQKKLAKLSENHYMSKTYKKEVLKELPGAPVGQHCLFGQYTQLKRALEEFGEDTLKLIPSAASKACTTFKTSMRQKYSDSEYKGAIKEGKLYKNKEEYNLDLEKFIASRIKPNLKKDSLINASKKEFAKKHFTIDELDAGTIMIVPRTNNSKRLFHAIVYIGCGFIDKSGNFIESKNGKPMFAANNRERAGELFSTWNTNNVFVANIKQISMTDFRKEVQKLRNMPKEGLVLYLSQENMDIQPYLQKMDKRVLLNLAYYKYFGKELPEQQNTPNNYNNMLAMLNIRSR